VWREAWSGEVFDFLDRGQRSTDTKLGVTPATLEAVRLTKAPKGVAAGSLQTGQRDALVQLLHRYLDRLPDDLAGLEAAKVLEDLDALHFLWAGGTEPRQPHYYRVQGPRLLVEYDNTARDANHVHSVWRDLTNDFGVDVLARHRAEHH
jgi:hypothetical protein